MFCSGPLTVKEKTQKLVTVQTSLVICFVGRMFAFYSGK